MGAWVELGVFADGERKGLAGSIYIAWRRLASRISPVIDYIFDDSGFHLL